MIRHVFSSPVIVALDYARAGDARLLYEQLDPAKCGVKVGKELFCAEGPAFIRELVSHGFRVFLDLKFHDIPNTVAAACRVAADLGVWMLNVHASGGEPMMLAARSAVPRDGPLLIGVTVLTSLGGQDLAAVGFTEAPDQLVLRLARLAQQAGLDGVVCSAQEAPALRASMASPFCLVTPGIRLEAGGDDQQRTQTPAEAYAAGADYLVVGRPITRAERPMDALEKILKQLECKQ